MLKPDKKVQAGNSGNSNVPDMSVPQLMPAPMIKITVQDDSITKRKFADAYYHSGRDIIVNNVVIGEEKNERDFLLTMTHEFEHQLNAKEGVQTSWMSLEQYYKLCVYDEISANIAQGLDLREKYIQAKTDDEREQIA